MAESSETTTPGDNQGGITIVKRRFVNKVKIAVTERNFKITYECEKKSFENLPSERQSVDETACPRSA